MGLQTVDTEHGLPQVGYEVRTTTHLKEKNDHPREKELSSQI